MTTFEVVVTLSVTLAVMVPIEILLVRLWKWAHFGTPIISKDMSPRF